MRAVPWAILSKSYDCHTGPDIVVCPDCRLELQYGHQRKVAMIPLMMLKNYQPNGSSPKALTPAKVRCIRMMLGFG